LIFIRNYLHFLILYKKISNIQLHNIITIFKGRREILEIFFIYSLKVPALSTKKSNYRKRHTIHDYA